MTDVVDFVNDIELPLLNGQPVDTADVKISDVERHTGDLKVVTVEILDDTGALVERPTYALAEHEMLRQLQVEDEVEILRVVSCGDFSFTVELEMHGRSVQVIYVEEDVFYVYELNRDGDGDRLDYEDMSRNPIKDYETLLGRIEAVVMPF